MGFISCLLLASTLAQTEAAFDVVSSETKEAMAHLKQQKKELVVAEDAYMKIVDSLDGALRTVIKESDDVEEAQSALEASQAKDKSGNKKAAEREEANINRQKEAIENAENRDGQLLQQKINSVQKAVERTEGDAEAAKEKADEAVKNIEEDA